MSPLEMNSNLVEVRSVTTTMGHEADIVIVDFTSAEKAGFMEYKEVCVATTRARYVKFFILNPATAKSTN